MKTILINHQPVELYKILKFENLVYGGGEAKIVIAEGMVAVNGQIETQKRKKIVAGDVIEFDGEEFLIELDQSKPAEPAPQAVQKPQEKPKSQPQDKPAKPRRSAIKF